MKNNAPVFSRFFMIKLKKDYGSVTSSEFLVLAVEIYHWFLGIRLHKQKQLEMNGGGLKWYLCNTRTTVERKS